MLYLSSAITEKNINTDKQLKLNSNSRNRVILLTHGVGELARTGWGYQAADGISLIFTNSVIAKLYYNYLDAGQGRSG